MTQTKTNLPSVSVYFVRCVFTGMCGVSGSRSPWKRFLRNVNDRYVYWKWFEDSSRMSCIQDSLLAAGTNISLIIEDSEDGNHGYGGFSNGVVVGCSDEWGNLRQLDELKSICEGLAEACGGECEFSVSDPKVIIPCDITMNSYETGEHIG